MRATLKDREGITHRALIPNDEDAWWTPIACGEGICLPGPQTADPVTCPDCLRRLALASSTKDQPTTPEEA